MLLIRSLVPRFNILRVVKPGITAPLLPTTRARGTLPRAGQLFHRFPARLTNSPPPSLNSLPQSMTLSQRLKHLIKSYGWYALGVYLILSALDFGVAFVGINLLGADYVSRVAAQAKHMIVNSYHSRPAEPGRDEIDRANHGNQGGSEGLYAMLVLAYTIHKTLFLPIRIGLTAAFTPRLVGWLRRRGWIRGATSEVRNMMHERSWNTYN